MRIRTLIAGGLLALVALVALPQAAFAADPGTTSGNDLVVCVKKALSDNQAAIAKKQYTGFTNALDRAFRPTASGKHISFLEIYEGDFLAPEMQDVLRDAAGRISRR